MGLRPGKKFPRREEGGRPQEKNLEAAGKKKFPEKFFFQERGIIIAPHG
jgi:hypothetical protein